MYGAFGSRLTTSPGTGLKDHSSDMLALSPDAAPRDQETEPAEEGSALAQAVSPSATTRRVDGPELDRLRLAACLSMRLLAEPRAQSHQHNSDGAAPVQPPVVRRADVQLEAS